MWINQNIPFILPLPKHSKCELFPGFKGHNAVSSSFIFLIFALQDPVE